MVKDSVWHLSRFFTRKFGKMLINLPSRRERTGIAQKSESITGIVFLSLSFYEVRSVVKKRKLSG